MLFWFVMFCFWFVCFWFAILFFCHFVTVIIVIINYHSPHKLVDLASRLRVVDGVHDREGHVANLVGERDDGKSKSLFFEKNKIK